MPWLWLACKRLFSLVWCRSELYQTLTWYGTTALITNDRVATVKFIALDHAGISPFDNIYINLLEKQACMARLAVIYSEEYYCTYLSLQIVVGQIPW